MKKEYLILVLLLIFSLLIFSACEAEEATVEVEEQLTVYSSFYPIHFMTEYIGGERITAKSVVPSGNEVHGYDISVRKMADLEDSDLLFYLGLELEPWAERVADNLSDVGVPTYKLSQGLDLLEYDRHGHSDEEHDGEHYHEEDSHDQSHEEHDDEHSHGKYDAHVWTDPINMKEIAGAIKNELVRLDPEGRELYEENHESLKEKLIELHNKYQIELAGRNSDYFLVSHSAFAYLADRYGLKEISVTGLTPHAEPSPNRIAELIDITKNYELDYIFLEVLAAPEVAEVLADEAGLEILILDPVEGLANEADDYFSVMERNLENLKKELVD